MGRSDPGPQKYKESNQIDCNHWQKLHSQQKYRTEVVLRSKTNDFVKGFSTTGDKIPSSRYCAHHCPRVRRSKSEPDCSQFQYLRHNLYIKSAVEKQNDFNFQKKKVSFRNYTPKILRQEVNMGMWM
ncbi:uncharacterized protein LOC143193801 [Rhynchophorus ferrugineus]|uniref:uncharacterized protein LOC143193801 n=1 Tax=Rhynchophorus ferrugineus TaxID=354439 RepID=UPI003FCC9CF2